MPSLVDLTRDAVAELESLRFGDPVACVYNPLDHAWDLHRKFLQRYGRGTKRYVLLGMNPGPFGMVQTGVPFGEVEAVRSWLRIDGEVKQPKNVHPKRPVEGLACKRAEVSGRRVWGWAARRFVTPTRFFRQFYVHNYCPLAFVSESGSNLTPDKLKKADSKPLFEICDRMLRRVIDALRPELVIGIGAFAEDRARRVLSSDGPRIGRIPHPSPASPAANRGWERIAEEAFAELGVELG